MMIIKHETSCVNCGHTLKVGDKAEWREVAFGGCFLCHACSKKIQNITFHNSSEVLEAVSFHDRDFFYEWTFHDFHVLRDLGIINVL